MMTLFNQNDYANVPYPSPVLPGATLMTGGCGVVSMMMILANMGGIELSAKEAADYAISVGARVSGGTDMLALSKAVCRDYGFEFFATSDEDTMLRHLKNSGFAIANVGGDRTGWTGVYANGGHYIVLCGAFDDTVNVLDPGYYPGKYHKAGRTGKVSDNGDGSSSCPVSVMAQDTYARTPAYYLFTKEGFEMAQFTDTQGHWAETSIEKAAEKGLVNGKEDGLFHPDDQLTRAEFVTVLDRLGLLD